MASATRNRTIWKKGAPVCALWLTEEKNPASAYAHQCRTGVTTNAQSRIEFVGQTGETNRGGRLLATVSVLRKHANPTSRALTAKPRSGWRWPARGAPWARSGAATRNPRAEASMAGPSDRTVMYEGRRAAIPPAGPQGQADGRLLRGRGPAQPGERN